MLEFRRIQHGNWTMAIELERRFLVTDRSIVNTRIGTPILQGYLAKDGGGMSTRVRISGDQAWLTLKSSRKGYRRDEFEYPIPVQDARTILINHCGKRIIEKTRYRISHQNHCFEVDVFCGGLSGLIIAELEVDDIMQLFSPKLPSWIGCEVTHDHRYGNSSLAEFGLPSSELILSANAS